jgi:hypothetical protein
MALNLFPARVRIADANGFASPEFLRALQAVFERVGGATGPSTTDLATSDDDDSGLEEIRSEFAKALDALACTPVEQVTASEYIEAEIASLREQIADLYTLIAGIQQRTEL